MMSRNETSSAGRNRYGDGGLSSSSPGDEFRLLFLSSTETSVERAKKPSGRESCVTCDSHRHEISGLFALFIPVAHSVGMSFECSGSSISYHLKCSKFQNHQNLVLFFGLVTTYLPNSCCQCFGNCCATWKTWRPQS
jgi:hypothetical protein